MKVQPPIEIDARAEAFGPLQLVRGPFRHAAHQAAYDALLWDALTVASSTPPDATWTSFALFEGDGACVANVDAAVLPLMLDRRFVSAAAIRSVAVASPWRGRGLFRKLMVEALAFCDARAASPTLLYTAEPDLYGRFGFHALPQHAFAGPAPATNLAGIARPLDLSRHQDRSLMSRMVEARTPVSMQAALNVSPSLVLSNLAKDDAPAIVHVADADAVVMFEDDGDTLVVADVIAPVIPPLAVLLGALGRRPRRVKTLFPPDRLEWAGEPVREDTGLMIRGEVPEAMTRPFMFPPTAEF